MPGAQLAACVAAHIVQFPIGAKDGLVQIPANKVANGRCLGSQFKWKNYGLSV